MSSLDWNEAEALLTELVTQQKEKVYQCALRINPRVTEEDILQPNDFNELELNPIFRYEEGVLEGLYTVQMALWAKKKETN